MPSRYAGRQLLPFLLMAMVACAPASTPVEPEFLDADWVIVEVDGVVVEPDTTRPALTLRLGREEQRASGHAGCNQFGGTWRGSADSLSFGPLAMTKMFCEGRMELESRYGQALGQVSRVQVVGGVLELLAGERVVVRARRGP
jgi:heat shock protein HslJ